MNRVYFSPQTLWFTCICCFKHSFLLICSMPWPSCICLRSSLIELFLWASDWSPETLCLSSSHFFYYTLISARKQIRSEYLSLTKSSEQFFLLPLPSFLVPGVFNNLHTMPLLAPSLAKCERNCDYLIDWRVPGEEISINHLIST